MKTIKSIYKITKPLEPMSIYIGATIQTLNSRLKKHMYFKRKYPNRDIYKWLDSTCIIEEIGQIEGEIRSDFEKIEYEYVEHYRTLGYIVVNFQDGRSLNNDYEKLKKEKDKESGKTKIWSAKNNIKYKESGQAKIWRDNLKESGQIKIWSDKHNAINKESGQAKIWSDKHNSNRNPDYCNWCAKINRAAKKEGIKAKEYRKKYNIPDYTGPRKINEN